MAEGSLDGTAVASAKQAVLAAEMRRQTAEYNQQGGPARCAMHALALRQPAGEGTPNTNVCSY